MFEFTQVERKLDIDFKSIRSLEGSQANGFEEFCCQLAHRESPVPDGSQFFRLHGAGGDGGIECYWRMPSGEMWGYQAKYLFELKKSQLNASVKATLNLHPQLKKYVICIPFDLTGPTGRGGKNQIDIWNEYVKEWEELANKKDMDVKFILWPKSILIDRLLNIPNESGRIKYWFGREEIFDLNWFGNQISNSISSVGPRYTPELNIKVPIAQCFESLANTQEWREIVREYKKIFNVASNKWKRTIGRKASADDEVPLSNEAKNIANKLEHCIDQISFWLSNDSRDQNAPVEQSSEAILLCETLEKACLADLENSSSTFADTPGYRQFMAEYQCCFPAQYLDATREFYDGLCTFQQWVSQPFVNLPSEQAVLITGFAGSGKTHAFCDAARQRLNRGLPSVLLLGEQFNSDEPWDQIRRFLGLGADWSRTEILSALDSSGEAVGSPCIIFIDALNETVPRKGWKTYLPSLIEAISEYQWVKICLSCRTTYLSNTIPDHISTIRIDHRGFENIEHDACYRFFEYYGLEAPAMPLLQPEFTSPLFLRLVCEAVSKSNSSYLTDDLYGISSVIQLLLDSNNKDIADHLDYAPQENHVGAAVRAVAQKMTSLGRGDLEWGEAKSIVDEVWQSQTREQSLFHQMLRNGLLVEDYTLAHDSEAPVNTIRFAFERVSDHLRAQSLLDEIKSLDQLKQAFEKGGILNSLISDNESIETSQGVLIELSILIPENYSARELIDFAADSQTRCLLLRTTINGIVWRLSSGISPRTKYLVREALGTPHTAHPTMDVLSQICCRPNHLLNSDFFYSLFCNGSIIVRDAFLNPYFYLQFEENGNFRRLINWALEQDLSGISTEAARLWVKYLAWACSSSDLRIRDSATRGMICIGELFPQIWSKVFLDFCDIGDDYILERVLLASYGTLIRTADTDALSNLTDAIWEQLFRSGDPTTNVLVRDLGRLVLELAEKEGVLPYYVIRERFLPPYQSKWPLELPDEEWKKQFIYHEIRAVDRLFQSCTNDDFQKYTTHQAIDLFEKTPWNEQGGIELNEACLWIFHQIIDLGYAESEQLTQYDEFLIGKYGTGRGRDSWGERVGKKYQRIALYQLLGILYDNVEINWEAQFQAQPRSTLQAEYLRNFDPTILIDKSPDSSLKPWWFKYTYNFQERASRTDDEWLNEYDDFSLSSSNLIPSSHSGEEWVVVSMFSGQNSKEDRDDDGLYRKLELSVHGYLVKSTNADRFWKWIRKQDIFENGTLRRPKEVPSSVFLGEYPWASSVEDFLEQSEFEASYDHLSYPVFSAAFCKNIELRYDAIERNNFFVSLPTVLFFEFETLSWDGSCGYSLSNSNELVIDCPAVKSGGPNSLIVRRDFLDRFLDENDFALFWTVTSTRMVLGGGFTDSGRGYAEKSVVHRYSKSKIRSSKERTYRITPGSRVEVSK